MLPRRPSVITVVDMDEGDYTATWTPTGTLVSSGSTSTLASTSMSNGLPSPGHRDLMKTIDLRDAEPIASGGEEQFSFIVHFPEDEDAGTVFEEKRPRTSRGFRKGGSGNSSDVKSQNISLLLVTAARKLQFLPVKMRSAFARKIVQY